MLIWIDADACPRIIKEIVFRASERLQVPVCLVANTNLSKAHSRLVTSVQVAEGPDAADDHIVLHAAPDDLVITADIPLAARIVERAMEIDPEARFPHALALLDALRALLPDGFSLREELLPARGDEHGVSLFASASRRPTISHARPGPG